MKKLMILIVVAIALISGCVGNYKNVNTSVSGDKITSNLTTDAATDPTNNGSVLKNLSQNISGNFQAKSASGSNMAKESDWCRSGSKITAQLPSGNKEYTVIGLTTYMGRDVCQAEMTYENGKSTEYFSKDGSFKYMISSAAGSGTVNSEAESDTNVK